MKSFQRGVFQRKRINEYGEQRGKSKQNDLDLATDLYWFSFTFFLDSGRSHNQNVTLESTLSEISGLIKISVKHKREEKYLGRNATSFNHRENQQEKKRELKGNFQNGNCHPFYFPTESALESDQLWITTFTSDEDFGKAIKPSTL